MKNLKEQTNQILANPHFLKLGNEAFNLELYPKGKHEAKFISSLGRCFSESKKQRTISRVELGKMDFIRLMTNLEYEKFEDELFFSFSNSGKSLYFLPTKSQYEAVVSFLKKGR